VIIAGHHVGEPQQIGQILEVLGTERRHFRVRWEDGHDSIFFPGSDAVIRPARRRRSTRKAAAQAPSS
jgi:hypothetical protein